MASDPVRLEVEGDVGFLVIDNPPVNALSRAVVAGLAEQLELAVRHDGIRAVVIICAGGTFAAGADISEFGVEPGPRPLPDLPRRIEDCRKPVIAALHGTAFGGGLELALACHYRIARADTRLGFPEVRLGLLPGAGGTQWLPRIVGAERALAMMLGGKPIAGVDAKQMGLLDDIAEGELRHDAAALAARVLAAGAARPRVRDRAVAPGSVPPGLFEADRARAPRNRPGQFAPARIIDCVEAAITMPFDEGLALERRLFAECLQSRESEALRHIFFAEREAARLPDVPRDTPVRNITRVGIVGAGTMGGGIAMALAGAGIRVWLQDIDQGSLHRGMAAIRRNYEVSQRKGRLSAAELEVTLGRIEPTPDLAALADADLVIEAAYENMAVKQQVFTMLDRVCRPGAILATNTSTLDVDEIARATTRPRDVIGLHFFSPANVMRLLEVVRGAATAPDVLATCMQLARRIGKVAVVSGVCPGFIGNRMLGGYGREAALLVLEGASPARVDRALTDFGMAMGPMAVGDLAGLDIGVRAADEARAAGRGSPDPRSGALARRLVAMGRMGLKAGKGLYRYEPGSRSPLPDPEVESLIREEAVRLNVPQREASDEEIVARCIYPLINEACFILEEGIALRPGDIDVVWTSGYGFPAYRGGPLFHADTIGVRHVFDAICRFGDRDGDPYGYWRPAPLLAALARDGRSFADLGDARSHHG